MRGILTVIFLLSVTILFSQEPVYKQYTVKDGLAGGTVYQSIQDKNGYLWFATNQGVSRFDGNSFRNFTKEDGLPDNDIIKLYIDTHDNLWFISMIGIPSVYLNGKIISFPNCSNINAISEDVQTKTIILISATSHIFGSYESINIPGGWNFIPQHIVQDSGHVTSRLPVLRYSSTRKRIYFTYADDILTCTIQTSKGSRSFKTVLTPSEQRPPFGKPAFFSVNRRSESILFYTTDSLYLCNDTSITPIERLQNLKLNIKSEKDISSLLYEDEKVIWITTRNRGLIFISDFQQPKKNIQYYFQNSYCTSVLKDSEGGYWVTTHNDGVYYIPNRDFRTLSKYNNPVSRDVKSIRVREHHTIVAGFADGNIMEMEETTLNRKPYLKWATQHKNNRILDIDFYGNNLIIASDKGVYKIAANESFEQLSLTAAKGVYVDDSSFILGALADGIRFIKNSHSITTIFHNRTTAITGMGKTYVWGTLTGLFRFYENKIEFLGDHFPELSVIINHVAINKDSSLWASTPQGIVILRNNRIYKITKKDGIASNTCKHILFDRNAAWVSTDQGLVKIDYTWKQNTPTFKIANITEADGLVSNDVNQSALSDNFIWVATSNGISYFPKDFITGSGFDPEININRVLIGGQEVPVKDSLFIKPEQGIAIELSGISFKSGKELKYEYRFSGSGRTWTKLSNNKIDFTALPFGNLGMEIRAIDRWGNFSKKPLFITIINKPPFWRTSWFEVLSYLVSTVLICLLVYSYSKHRQKNREKEFYEKRRMLELEVMAFRSQINPHFIFNCLSSIQHHILKSDPVSANNYLHKLSTLIRKTLQSSSSPTILLSEEISIIKVYLELQKLRLEDKLEYVINVDEAIYIKDTRIPSMIIQPFVENAIKHGISPEENKKGIININITKTKNIILCEIEDNGIGINASARKNQKSAYVSMGSNITERRIKAINSMQEDKVHLEIHDKKDIDPELEGTIVKITFIIKNPGA